MHPPQLHRLLSSVCPTNAGVRCCGGESRSCCPPDTQPFDVPIAEGRTGGLSAVDIGQDRADLGHGVVGALVAYGGESEGGEDERGGDRGAAGAGGSAGDYGEGREHENQRGFDADPKPAPGIEGLRHEALVDRRLGQTKGSGVVDEIRM